MYLDNEDIKAFIRIAVQMNKAGILIDRNVISGNWIVNYPDHDYPNRHIQCRFRDYGDALKFAINCLAGDLD